VEGSYQITKRGVTLGAEPNLIFGIQKKGKLIFEKQSVIRFNVCLEKEGTASVV
jgi:hypothetical protein